MPIVMENIASPREVEMIVFYEELNKCNTNAVVLIVVEHSSKNYMLPSRNTQTIQNLLIHTANK